MLIRTILLLLFTSYGLIVFSQKYMVNRKNKAYLGISGGLNFSKTPVVDEYFALIQTSQSMEDLMKKDYEPLFKNKGSQVGLYFSFNVSKKLALVFQPAYQVSSFNYLTSITMADTINSTAFAMEMQHRQKLSTIHLPLLVRYDFTTSQFSPYVQGGIVANFRNRANKTIFTDYEIDSKVDVKTADRTEKSDITEHFNKFNFGLTAGAGLTYFSNYFALSLETNFSYHFRQLVNDANRYADYSGFTMQYLDVLDQLKLLNWNFQFTIMFPIDNSVSLDILRRKRH